MTMGRWGIHLERTQTWWPLASDWFRYQSRCQWMLQEGRFVADVLCWCGEEAPNGSQTRINLPRANGVKYDLCATRAVELLKVKNGKVVVPGGVEYELLVLPNTDTMSEKMLKRIGELVDAGARVVAQRRPVRAPGLSWGGKTTSVQQQEYRALVGSVWAKGVMECSVAAALVKLGVKPDFLTDAEDVSWIHRTGRVRSPSAPSHVDWYFVAQDNEIDSTFEASFRVTGRTPEIWARWIAAKVRGSECPTTRRTWSRNGNGATARCWHGSRLRRSCMIPTVRCARSPRTRRRRLR